MRTAIKPGAVLLAVLLTAACSNLGKKIERRLHWDLHPAESESQATQDEAVEGWVMVPSAQARELLLGKWYGRLNEDGLRKEWLIERASDGTYRADFLTTDAKGEQHSQSEVGFWGTSGGVYFRIFRGWVMLDGIKSANTKNPSFYDAYQILALDQNEMRYQHLEDERIYLVRKMPAEFRLPVKLKVRESTPLEPVNPPVTSGPPRLQF